MKKIDYLTKGLFLLLFCFVFFICGYGYREHKYRKGVVNEVIVHKADTIRCIDTVFIPKPSIIKERVIDSIFAIVHRIDTLYKTDTVYLPRLQRFYCNKEYSAWISGYEPQLDSIHIYSKTTTIYKERIIQKQQPTSRWGIGVQIGYGISIDRGQLHNVPYIGLGVTYRLF